MVELTEAQLYDMDSRRCSHDKELKDLEERFKKHESDFHTFLIDFAKRIIALENKIKAGDKKKSK
jgi:hypothetical protein